MCRFKKQKTNTQKGFSLIEVMLYIVLYSIISTGYITFMFYASESIASMSRIYDEIRLSLLMKELVVYRVDHTEYFGQEAGVKNGYIDVHIFDRILHCFTNTKIDKFTSTIISEKSDTELFPHYVLTYSYTLNTHPYSIRISLL